MFTCKHCGASLIIRPDKGKTCIYCLSFCGNKPIKETSHSRLRAERKIFKIDGRFQDQIKLIDKELNK